jgi:hypothetical protein
MKKRRLYISTGLILLAASMTMQASAQRLEVSAQFSGGESAYGIYFSSLSREHGVPYSDMCVMRNAGVVMEDMPVILYIYHRSPYSLRQIYSLRPRGATWAQLSNWCGVPLNFENGRCVTTYGPPYGIARGYYGHGKGKGKHSKRNDYERGR